MVGVVRSVVTAMATFLITCVLGLFISATCYADAMIRTKAMLATTIVEYYVEEKAVLVELEIGVSDLESFRNLLPDEIYNQLGYPPLSQAQRQRLFFEQDLSIVADGKILSGTLARIGSATRLQRDKITGQPLAVQPQEPELVIRAQLLYPFDKQPRTLTFGAPTGAGEAEIGFVAYHRGVAVNDFRYLNSGYRLTLDWQDAWYSAFSHRNLRRQYSAPISAFLYVEPFEVRKEIIVRPKDMQRWLDLGLEGVNVITPEMQGEIKLKVADFLSQYQPLTIDGKPVTGQLQRVSFLERTLTSSRVIDPPEPLRIDSAIMGIIFVYPMTTLPQKVVMEWDLWDQRIKIIPAATVDEAGPMPVYLQQNWQQLTWNNLLMNPTIPTLSVVAKPPSRWLQQAYNWRWLALILAVVVVLVAVIIYRRNHRGLFSVNMSSINIFSTKALLIKTVPITVIAALALVVAVAGFYVAHATYANPTQVRGVVAGLLHNIYRAFDYRDESNIYDVLDQSVKGNLLADIYLETQRGLELANQGGARAKVKTVELTSLDELQVHQGQLQLQASWIVTGSVGHWGHMHQRVNQYKADVIIESVSGVWKLTGMRVLEEQRL